MKKMNFKKFICLILAVMLLCCLMPVASAEMVTDSGIYCNEADVIIDDKEAGKGCLYISTYFISPAVLFDYADIDSVATAEDGCYVLTAPGFRMQYCADDHYIYINGRYYYSEDGFPVINGKTYIRVGLAESLFNIHASIENYSIVFDFHGFSMPGYDENYYEDNYGQENVWYLSHIISSEGYLDGLEGRIGIGDVVMHRVASPLYPDNIKDVIFDTKNGVQFSTAGSEEFNEEPNELSYIAAYLTLEGVEVVEDSFFFVSPQGCDTTWFDKNLEVVMDIDNLRFYRISY